MLAMWCGGIAGWIYFLFSSKRLMDEEARRSNRNASRDWNCDLASRTNFGESLRHVAPDVRRGTENIVSLIRLLTSAATADPRRLANEPRSARAALADCQFCAHHCGVNRLAGETGLCHAGAEARFFSAQVEVSDELELIPTFADRVERLRSALRFLHHRRAELEPARR